MASSPSMFFNPKHSISNSRQEINLANQNKFQVKYLRLLNTTPKCDSPSLSFLSSPLPSLHLLQNLSLSLRQSPSQFRRPSLWLMDSSLVTAGAPAACPVKLSPLSKIVHFFLGIVIEHSHSLFGDTVYRTVDGPRTKRVV